MQSRMVQISKDMKNIINFVYNLLLANKLYVSRALQVLAFNIALVIG
jgi:hypothetical protein